MSGINGAESPQSASQLVPGCSASDDRGSIAEDLGVAIVALYALCFSQAIGALWEIFEFAMDRFFGLTMQKPMSDDPSGLTDMMWVSTRTLPG